MRVLSLCDGISCGMIALERASIKVDEYIAYEIDENAIKISEENYPSIKHKGNVIGEDFTKYKGKVDLVIFGSPCQDLSIAKADRKGLDGAKSSLFYECARALKEIQPKYFLCENVASMSKKNKDIISSILGVEPIMINSDLVSAQNRKRLYWTNIPTNQPKDKNIKLTDVVDFKERNFRPIGKWVESKWGGQRKLDTLKSVHSIKSHTLTTSGTHCLNYYLNEDKTQYCNLTVEDWESLQTLPSGYVNNVNIPKCAKYKAIGNGWTVDVIAHIFKGINI